MFFRENNCYVNDKPTLDGINGMLGVAEYKGLLGLELIARKMKHKKV